MTFNSLIGQPPNPSTSDLLNRLVPPREFRSAKFENYVPDKRFPSQSEAVERAKVFLGLSKSVGGFFRKRHTGAQVSGIYLDGGFGVGKTHLLASIYHAGSGKKAFGSFLAYTSLIGLLGFAKAVDAFRKYDLVCIDEFELDDPGDTMLMSRFLSELDKSGTRFAATSNTPPNALGQGRFAAADFAREINAMADKFEMVSVDGEDYRHRPLEAHSSAVTIEMLNEFLRSQQVSGASVFLSEFDALLVHLKSIHQSKFEFLVQNVDVLGLTNVRVMTDQVEALRFVALVDRLYERQSILRGTGVGLTEVFSGEMLLGGYRKKYLRAISRLGSMSA